MSEHKDILVLFPEKENPTPPPLAEVINALGDVGVRVNAHVCDDHYDEILDAVEDADTIVFWR